MGAPAEPVPTGQRNTSEPAGLLPCAGAEIIGEAGAGADQAAVAAPNMGDSLPATQSADLEAKLIVLGQTLGAERIAALPHGDRLKHAAREGAAYPGSGKPCAQPAAHHKDLVMGLHELIAIMAADERGAGNRYRAHRKLDEVEPLDQSIIECNLIRMDQILGVMEHHGLGGLARDPFPP